MTTIQLVCIVEVSAIYPRARGKVEMLRDGVQPRKYGLRIHEELISWMPYKRFSMRSIELKTVGRRLWTRRSMRHGSWPLRSAETECISCV